MAFDNTAGQDRALEGLRAALCRGKVPHAYLFCGATGSGRLEVARELARILVCSDRPASDDYCGACKDCRLSAGFNHPDVHEAGVPLGRQLLPISTIREIQDNASLTPLSAERRVFILRDAERMTIDAANSFLKTLEEPPGQAVLILLATGLTDMPQTVVSRCRLVRFANLAPPVLAESLVDDGVPPDQAHWLSRRAWGSPGLAERFRRVELYDANRELLRRVAAMRVEDNFDLSDHVNAWADGQAGSAGERREATMDLLECLAVYYRDLAVAAEGGDDFCNGWFAEALRQAARPADADEFARRADVVLQTMQRVEANANRRLALDDMFTTLALRS
jgi:DNA polymerase-3 subunit delta'